MIILVGFILIPFLVGGTLEYLACRLPRRRWWRALPPVLILALAAVVSLGRLRLWTSQADPLPQLLFVPGLPALLALLGCLAGWRVWRRRWRPRVIRSRRPKGGA